MECSKVPICHELRCRPGYNDKQLESYDPLWRSILARWSGTLCLLSAGTQVARNRSSYRTAVRITIMKEWLKETHGTQFELLRHFLLRFFDSDLITAPGQAAPAVIGAISVFLPWFPVIIAPLKHKYAYVSSLATPDAYLRAVRAD